MRPAGTIPQPGWTVLRNRATRDRLARKSCAFRLRACSMPARTSRAGHPMNLKTATTASAPSVQPASHAADPLKQYEVGNVPLPRKAIDSFHRHLAFDHMVDPARASMRQRFQAISRSIRDLLAQRWLKTKATYYRENPKRVYYLSMEF